MTSTSMLDTLLASDALCHEVGKCLTPREILTLSVAAKASATATADPTTTEGSPFQEGANNWSCHCCQTKLDLPSKMISRDKAKYRSVAHLHQTMELYCKKEEPTNTGDPLPSLLCKNLPPYVFSDPSEYCIDPNNCTRGCRNRCRCYKEGKQCDNGNRLPDCMGRCVPKDMKSKCVSCTVTCTQCDKPTCSSCLKQCSHYNCINPNDRKQWCHIQICISCLVEDEVKEQQEQQQKEEKKKKKKELEAITRNSSDSDEDDSDSDDDDDIDDHRRRLLLQKCNYSRHTNSFVYCKDHLYDDDYGDGGNGDICHGCLMYLYY